MSRRIELDSLIHSTVPEFRRPWRMPDDDVRCTLTGWICEWWNLHHLNTVYIRNTERFYQSLVHSRPIAHGKANSSPDMETRRPMPLRHSCQKTPSFGITTQRACCIESRRPSVCCSDDARNPYEPVYLSSNDPNNLHHQLALQSLHAAQISYTSINRT